MRLAARTVIWACSGAIIAAQPSSRGRFVAAQDVTYGPAALIESARYSVVMDHRVAPGRPEIHRTRTQLFYGLKGSGVLVTDGNVANAVESEPNEVRGSDISGGIERRFSPGDVVAVPAGTPHWFKAVTAELDYYTVNIVEPAPDPIVGVWRLNLEKSNFELSFPRVRSQTRTYEDRGDGLIVATYEATDRQGQRAFTHYAYKRDGKEYPELIRGASTAATIAFAAVDAYTSTFVIKQDGVISTTGTVTVSRDGRTMTNRTDGRNAAGQPIVNVAVYDRET